jgi:hypothetical protein
LSRNGIGEGELRANEHSEETLGGAHDLKFVEADADRQGEVTR